MTEETNHYGATAARVHGRPGREIRPAGITIDCHAHVFIPEAMPLVAGKLDPMTIPLARFLLTWKGRLVEQRVEMNPGRVLSVGIALAGGAGMQPAGPFALEIQWIKAVNLHGGAAAAQPPRSDGGSSGDSAEADAERRRQG